VVESQDATLTDGGGGKPGYSLRTLCRALSYTRAALPAYGLQRALYDGAAMAFLTQLAPDSAPRMEALLRTHLLPGVTSLKVRAASVCQAPPGPDVMGLSHQTSNAEQFAMSGPKVQSCDVRFGQATELWKRHVTGCNLSSARTN
jgi:midasin (ATPase involved in ribosome maturation)